ncbi:MAG: glycosyltransferase family 39 protein [Candidatus Fermentibacteraceae bacterium]|nr:glycosyltransferase family 39 protein [Candidatus Fermentibacteraceae bacterium]
MGKYLSAVTGLVFLAGFALYASSDFRLEGPADKAVQLLVLVPSVVALSAAAAKLKQDPVGRVLSAAKSLSTAAFLCCVFVFVVLFTVFMATGPLQGIPKGGDEAAYLFQSRIFVSGHAAAPVPAVSSPRDLFPFRHFIFRDGRWFVMYTPMHAIIMAPFTAAGVSYLMGSFESILSLLGAFLLIRRLAGENTARLSVSVMALSPYFLFMSSSHMAHNTSLLFVTWALYCFVRGVQEKGVFFQLAAGFLLGLALNTKPYPVIPWSITITVVVFAKLGKRAIPVLLRVAAGAVIPVGFFLLTNNFYTGDPLSPAYNLARGGGLMGFGENKAWFPEYGDHAHTPLRGLMNIVKQAGTGSTILLGWPFLSLFPASAVLLDRKVLKKTWPLYTAILMIVPFMFIHYAAAVDYGPRHYYTTLPAFALLTVAGFSVIIKKWGRRASLIIAGLYIVCTLVVYIPDGIMLRSGPWQSIDSQPIDIAGQEAEVPAVVFMEASEHGYPNIMSGLLANDPFLAGDIVFCAHQTTQEDDQHLHGVFQGRNGYLFYMQGTTAFLEPWTPELSDELTPERDLRPEQAPENLPEAGN